MLACLYDVHGNLPALEGVLADAHQQGAERHLLGGDYCLYGGWPAETLTRLRQLEDATWIRGNVDRWVGGDDADVPLDEVRAAVADCRTALDEEALTFLRALPLRAELPEGLAVHASPASDMRSFLPDPLPQDDELLEGVTADRLVFGHTHLPFRRRAGGVELLNPGSVGLPWDGDERAAYALIHPDGTVEHRRVAYDRAAAAEGLQRAFGSAAWVATTRRRLERARFDV